MRNIIDLKEVGIEDDNEVGLKAALLAESASEAPVPAGFVVTSAVFQRVVSPQRERIKDILLDANLDEDSKAAQIAQLIKSLDIPEDIKKEIAGAYSRIGLDPNAVHSAHDVVAGKNIPVVIRNALYGVENENFNESNHKINISGAEDVLRNIKSSWADFFNEEVVEFMLADDVEFDDLRSATLVQKMIYTHKAGIIYTRNPDEGNDSEIVIDACWGLDDYFMIDDNESDRYILDKDTLEITGKDVKPQKYAYLVNKQTGEAVKKQIPENEWNVIALKDEEMTRLARLAKKIEVKVGDGLQIEFIIERDQAHVIQVSAMDEEEGEDEEGLAEEFADEDSDYEEDDSVEDYDEGEEPEYETDDEDYESDDVDEAEYEGEDEEGEYEESDDEHYEEDGEYESDEEYDDEADSFEEDLRELIQKYTSQNPGMQHTFEELEKDILKLLDEEEE